MLQQLISRIFTLLNASGYYKGALEVQNAINSASNDMYLQYRGSLGWYAPGNNIPAITPGETIGAMDALQECYHVIQAEGVPLTIESSQFSIDQVQVIEVQWVDGGEWEIVKMLPDNQYLRTVKNRVVPPTQEYPYGRLMGSFEYEIAPNNYFGARARCLCYPPDCAFTFVDDNAPVPIVTVQNDLIWLPDKIEPLLSRTIQKLGFNIQNGVLVQAGAQMEQKVG